MQDLYVLHNRNLHQSTARSSNKNSEHLNITFIIDFRIVSCLSMINKISGQMNKPCPRTALLYYPSF